MRVSIAQIQKLIAGIYKSDEQTVAIGDPVTPANKAAVNASGGLEITGDVTNDTADAGNPVKIGGKVSANSTIPTAIGAGNRTNAWIDQQGAQIVRPGRRTTYNAEYRLTTRPYALSSAIGANSIKQYATIYHGAGSLKTVRILRVSMRILSVSVATKIMVEFRRLSSATAPATGNPAITPITNDPGSASAEAICLALPTTEGSEASANAGWGAIEQDFASTGGASTANPPPIQIETVLFDANNSGEQQLLVMRSGTAEGYAAILDNKTASTVTCTISITFTEE